MPLGDKQKALCNLTFMTFNLMHMARMLVDAGGLPAHSNQVSQ